MEICKSCGGKMHEDVTDDGAEVLVCEYCGNEESVD